MKELPKQEHSGVYGVAIKDDKILMIKKSRGPYIGMYDLPGGRMEEGESMEEGLRREFVEEVDCKISEISLSGQVEDSLEYINPRLGETLFKHIWTYYKVALSDYSKIKDTPDGCDSLGAEWIALVDIKKEKVQIPNIVKKVLQMTLK